MSEVVSNASPLIVLAKADLLKILPALFSRVLVPQAVLDEIQAGPADDYEASAARLPLAFPSPA